jgi:Spy/CpxP family protein refolding chaperone
MSRMIVQDLATQQGENAMKALKIFAVVAVVLTLTVASVVTLAGKPAQVPSKDPSYEWFGDFLNSEDMVEVMIGHLKEELNLTDEQEAEVRPILQAHLEERMSNLKARRDQVRENLQTTADERQAWLKQTEEQLAGILTEEQMQNLRQMVEEHWGHALEMRSHVAQGDFPMHGNFGETLKELDLTLEQKKELFGIVMKYRDMHKETREEMQGIRKQFAATMQELLNSDDFDEALVRQTYQESTAKLEDVVVSVAKMFSEMKAVLTPEQQQILQERGTAFLEQMQEGGAFGQRFGFRNRMSKRHGMFSFRFRNNSNEK